VAHALMRAASRLFAMPGGEPLKLRVIAKHPDESGCGAHECARHKLLCHPRAGDYFAASNGEPVAGPVTESAVTNWPPAA
jgi:hypothetical protein